MNCGKVQKLLVEYAESTLTGRRKAKVELHLSTCEICRDELSQLEELREDIRSLGEPDREPDWGSFNRKLSQRLERETTAPARYPLWIPRLAVAAATAAILIILSFVALSRLRELPPAVSQLAAVPTRSGRPQSALADGARSAQMNIQPTEKSDFSYLVTDGGVATPANLSSEEIDEAADRVSALVGEDWGWASDEVALDDIYEQNMYDVVKGLTPEEFTEIYRDMESI